MAIINFWKNIFNFKDKTDVDNFLFGFLVNGLICALVCYFIQSIDNALILYGEIIIGSLFLIALTSASIRRLHDRGKSAWYLIWRFIPIFNFIFIIEMLRSSVESEEYSDRNYV